MNQFRQLDIICSRYSNTNKSAGQFSVLLQNFFYDFLFDFVNGKQFEN